MGHSRFTTGLRALAAAAFGFQVVLISTAGQAADVFADRVQPFLKQHCLACHAAKEPKGDLRLDNVTAANDAAGKARWQTILEKLRNQEMPPEDKPQPAAADRQAVVSWIEASVLGIDRSKIDPGRVTIRRLNRTEYNNTIRDLVGVDFRPADDFPSDDVGYGFDNIADVLTLPPLLLEKYLAAAEKIAETAIVPKTSPDLATQQFGWRDLESTAGRVRTRGGARALNENGEAFVSATVEKAGEYIFRVRAYGQQAGDEPPRMTLKVDDRSLDTFDVKATERRHADYEKKVKLEARKIRLAAAYINDYMNPDEPDATKRDRNLAVVSFELIGPLDVPKPALPESHRRIIFVEPQPGAHDGAARKICERLATRAYRRPATKSEIDRLAAIVAAVEKDGETFERGVQVAMQAVLVSPHFLFRIELDPADGAIRDLNDFELATRLSYFLWSTMPDEELFTLAGRNELRKGDNFVRQARRMLADPRSRALVDNFAGQWLQTRSLKTVTPAKDAFPTFDEKLAADMRTETETFFANIVREDRSVLEFLDADYTFVNERLAKHYGLAGVTGEEFRRVALSGGQRGGVLSQATVLTVTSNPTRTSPVKRGKWILENLLGTPPPPPPPDVPLLSEEKSVVLSGTLRQRMEQHRTNPNCYSCHIKLDPLGFGLENYDAIGRWRSEDGKFPVDASGTLPGGKTFNGPKELKAILLSRRDQFRRCLSEKMLTYALGRGLEAFDQPTIERIAAELARNEHKFSSLVLAVVTSDPFQKRKGRKGEP